MECIVAHDSCEGRLDHVLANIDTLFHAPRMTAIPVYLLSGESLSCLLRPGKNVIDINEASRGQWCSLVPIGHPCSKVTTTGLKYNLGESLSLWSSELDTVGYYYWVLVHPGKCLISF